MGGCELRKSEATIRRATRSELLSPRLWGHFRGLTASCVYRHVNRQNHVAMLRASAATAWRPARFAPIVDWFGPYPTR
ncbi:hypothetical protein GCM10010401_01930 [Rarobacter faecitabidus]|uniref:Uncharacterized protein n=1 Tax=Rarobacter faecitabidus TaxID=13243 RepID=A0A542ZWG5_RARFA|nr:hypothetical protein FB461_1181 [Rarobacter faecitabidus]